MKKALFGMLLFGAGFNAQAVLIDNGSSVTDTATGYEWLDLSATTNRSYNNVVAQLASGGIFDGWSLAGTTEIYTLFDAAGGNGAYSGGSSSYKTYGHSSLTASLLSNWGSGSTYNTSSYLYFNVEDYTPGGHTTGFILAPPAGFSYDSMRYYQDYFSNPAIKYNIGTALYRNNGDAMKVPEPSSMLLMSLGLVGLRKARGVVKIFDFQRG